MAKEIKNKWERKRQANEKPKRRFVTLDKKLVSSQDQVDKTKEKCEWIRKKRR